MYYSLPVILTVFAAFAIAVILADPTAARIMATRIERICTGAVSLLRAHAAAREGAKAAYRRIWRNARAKASIRIDCDVTTALSDIDKAQSLLRSFDAHKAGA